MTKMEHRGLRLAILAVMLVDFAVMMSVSAFDFKAQSIQHLRIDTQQTMLNSQAGESPLVPPSSLPKDKNIIDQASSNVQQWTTIHESGRCAIRGQCGKKSFFGGELPCPDNGLADAPTQATRDQLVQICGEKWQSGNVCCDGDQISALKTNLKRAESIISSCPACKSNFYNLFCTFTCSPDQSLFVNVTDQGKSTKGKAIVTELDNLWADEYGSGFYDSCKDVKFGATGGKAMDFIGGGAKNFTAFLKFLGDEKLLGSPFQINFPRPSSGSFTGMVASDPLVRRCNSSDQAFRCACVDCPSTCPQLTAIDKPQYCHIGALPCLSFSVILVYCILLGLLVTIGTIHAAYQKHKKHKRERLQLLQDDPRSDEDEDDDDIGYLAQNSRYLASRTQRPYHMNSFISNAFIKLGCQCGRYPLITIGSSILVVLVLSIGWTNFQVETNPVRLWVSPDSATAREKSFFDENFGPFYRTQQVFVVNDTLPSGPGPVLSFETLKWWADVETRVRTFTSPLTHRTLEDLCFNPTGRGCVTPSVIGYFGDSPKDIPSSSWQEKLQRCTEQPGSQECLPAWQQPLTPDLVLGGIKEGNALSAQSLIATWLLVNYQDGSSGEAEARDWEAGLQKILLDAQREAQDRQLRLSYSIEGSVEAELNASSNTDARIVVFSYVVMFLYASLALGSTSLSVRALLRNPTQGLVQSKFSLGIMGILIVLMSVSASVGLFSACGFKVTLIIAEVIPFLVLAVGVDNIFLIVHEFESVNVSQPDDDIPTRIGRAMGRIGPSILLSATTEIIAFALGVAVGMPAVRNFAIYAAGSVFINSILQITLFVAVLTLNQQRVEAGRADCMPCIVLSGRKSALFGNRQDGSYGYEEEGPLQGFIRKVYAPLLLSIRVKSLVVLVFLGIFVAGLALIPTVQLGLDQRIAFPRGSHLISFFDDYDAYLNVGPPVYFVVKDLDVRKRLPQQKLCGRFSTCHDFSLTNVLEQEAKRPNLSFVTGSTASWIDDFFTWLNPSNEACCVDDGSPCFADRKPPWNVSLHGMPQDEEFGRYLSRWLASPSNEECPFGGAAAYSHAVALSDQAVESPKVKASHFRTSHTPLHSQSDFIDAYASARRIAADLAQEQNIQIFPYSPFYIFFDQYASIVGLAGTLLGAGCAAIFILTSILLGSLTTGFVVTVTVAMVVVDIIGVMALTGVSLNAISLVNLVISLGIAVEFCAHIARAFTFPSQSVMAKLPTSGLPFMASQGVSSFRSSLTHKVPGGALNPGLSVSSPFAAFLPFSAAASPTKSSLFSRPRDRDLRAWTALVNVGGTVLSGITLTKLLGVVVLAFTHSKIFEIYYFRIWLALVVLASTHALIWLPVALSLVGGRAYADHASSAGPEDDLARRRYRALASDDLYEDANDSDEY